MLTLLAAALAASFAIGFLAGGRPGRLADLRIRAIPLVFAALGLSLVQFLFDPPDALDRALLIGANVLVLGFLGWNLTGARGLVRVGFAVLALGWGLNAVVIAANGAMPLSASAYERSGQTEAPTPGEGGFFKGELAGPDTRLRFLGDVIPIRAVRRVVSAGDLALVTGIAVVIVGGMRGGGSRTRPGQAPEPAMPAR